MARNQVMILGGVTLVAGAAVAMWLALAAREAPAPQAAIPSSTAPAPTQAPAQPPVAANQPEAPHIVEVLPRFGVRNPADGLVTLEGQALPGAAITVRVEGAIVAQTAADGSGFFALLIDLGYSDTARVISLEMEDAEGRVVEAPDTLILLPRPAPMAVEAEQAVGEAPAGDEAVAEATTPPAEAVATEAGEALAQAPVEAVAEPAAPVEAVAQDTGEATPAPVEVVAQATAEPEAEAPAEGLAQAPVVAASGGTDAPAESGAPVAAASPAGEPANAATTRTDPEVARAETPEPPLSAAEAAPAATAILMRGDGRVEVLDRAPQVMDNVVIDAISYSDAGDVQISGRAAAADPAANLRIYLDNRPVALAVAEGGDWTLDLPAIDAGIYTLRVDQIGAEGGVVSRFETPFLREAPEALAQARARSDSGQAAATPEPVQTASLQAAPSPPRAELITVQPGNTLWAISRERYGQGERYVVIFNANRSQIRDPDLIYPGQVFALPDE